MPAIRRNGLEHLISDSQDIPTKYIISTEDDGTTKSTLRPNFVMCCKPDQLLLSWLLSTITESIICAVTHCTASLELLTVLEKIYSSQSMARSIVLRMQLHSTRKDNMIISEYCTKMRNLDLTEAMSLCWGAGLQCFKTFLFEELCSILLSHEARLEQQATAEAQAAYEANVTMKHECGMNEKKEGHGKGYNPNQGPGKSHGGRGSNNNRQAGECSSSKNESWRTVCGQ
ncbi:hypothetical protein WN943_027089 [Citrus x changshan-huyou]